MKYQDFKNAMDSHFLDTSNYTLNKNYLLHSLEIYIDNTERLINDICYNNRRKIHSVVWQGLQDFIMNHITYSVLYPMLGQHKKNYIVSSEQIKKYFAEYGYNYKDILSDLIEQYETERKERQEERKKEKEV